MLSANDFNVDKYKILSCGKELIKDEKINENNNNPFQLQSKVFTTQGKTGFKNMVRKKEAFRVTSIFSFILSTLSKTKIIISATDNMSSANALNLVE